MNPTDNLADVATQLATLNSNLSVLNATLQDFRWWMLEQMENNAPQDGQLTFWDQYQPPVTPQK